MNVRRLALACILLALGACASNGRPDPVIEALAGRQVVYEVMWRSSVGDPDMLQTIDEELGGLALDGTGRTLVATSSAGEVIAFDASTGARLWTASFDGEPLAAAPTIADGLVLVGTPSGILHALTLASGTERWAYTAGAPISSQAVVDGDLVVLHTSDAVIHGVAADDGRPLWQFEHRPTGRFTMRGDAPPTVMGDAVFAGFADGSLGRLNMRGDAVWLTDLSGEARRLVDVDSRPTLSGDLVLASSFAAGLIAVRAADGVEVWRVPLTGATTPVSADGPVVTTTANGEVVWIDPDTGDVTGTLELDVATAGPGTRFGDLLLVPTPRGLYILDLHHPWIFGRFDPDSGIQSAPVIAGPRVFVLSDGGNVYAVELRDAGAN